MMRYDWRYDLLMLRYDWRHELRRHREQCAIWVAWHVPKWLAYWCAIRVMAHATTGEYGDTNPTEEPMMTALQRWG